MSAKPRRFFLVDDNEIDLTVNAKLIQIAGLAEKVIAFQTAQDFLTAVKEDDEITSFDNIVLLDIMMPIMNGFECAEVFSALPNSIADYFRVYVLSSTIDRNDLRRAGEIPVVLRVLEKPLDTYQLRELLNS